MMYPFTIFKLSPTEDGKMKIVDIYQNMYEHLNVTPKLDSSSDEIQTEVKPLTDPPNRGRGQIVSSGRAPDTQPQASLRTQSDIKSQNKKAILQPVNYSKKIILFLKKDKNISVTKNNSDLLIQKKRKSLVLKESEIKCLYDCLLSKKKLKIKLDQQKKLRPLVNMLNNNQKKMINQMLLK